MRILSNNSNGDGEGAETYAEYQECQSPPLLKKTWDCNINLSLETISFRKENNIMAERGKLYTLYINLKRANKETPSNRLMVLGFKNLDLQSKGYEGY